jgi:hypothetical protein
VGAEQEMHSDPEAAYGFSLGQFSTGPTIAFC